MRTASVPKAETFLSVAKSAQSIDELGSAFEISERANPEITELFVKIFLQTLLTGSKESDKDIEAALQNLSRA